MQTSEAVAQFTKGLGKFMLHFALLVCGLATLVRAGERGYWRALRWLVAGLVANALYGVLQYGVAKTGGNLDAHVIHPLTGSTSAINKYGAVGTTAVNRMNALTGDPNHLGIMLCVPLLPSRPSTCGWSAASAGGTRSGLVLAFLLLVDIGDALAQRRARPARRRRRPRRPVRTRAALAELPRDGRRGRAPRRGLHRDAPALRRGRRPLAHPTGGSSTSPHTAVYGFIPKMLHLHPLLGLGLNDFSIYYQFVTGKYRLGPALVLRRADRRERARRDGALRALPALRVPAAGAVRRVGLELLRAGDPAGRA